MVTYTQIKGYSIDSTIGRPPTTNHVRQISGAANSSSSVTNTKLHAPGPQNRYDGGEFGSAKHSEQNRNNHRFTYVVLYFNLTEVSREIYY
ncbi:hypothetical protein BDA96_08G205100 [Sorghum bicolor]|uniref:Uncharacterized protein n=2 Tax=Sorghum bicolor TaxID=4558 RepID=A0A921QI00_SORBI|nr:hypothetical protein BDA96_08G205100 [Sorghum bicolor]OQU79724.1 hypothetical protein SORBI_3008G187450 [Sorghum bicolor]